MLNPLAFVSREIFRDLTLVVREFIQRNPDLAIGAGHRARFQAGQLAFDIEVADFAEIEEVLVELRPVIHPPAEHIVRQVIDARRARRPAPVLRRLAMKSTS